MKKIYVVVHDQKQGKKEIETYLFLSVLFEER
jgi:hypothetical protein